MSVARRLGRLIDLFDTRAGTVPEVAAPSMAAPRVAAREWQSVWHHEVDTRTVAPDARSFEAMRATFTRFVRAAGIQAAASIDVIDALMLVESEHGWTRMREQLDTLAAECALYTALTQRDLEALAHSRQYAGAGAFVAACVESRMGLIPGASARLFPESAHELSGCEAGLTFEDARCAIAIAQALDPDAALRELAARAFAHTAQVWRQSLGRAVWSDLIACAQGARTLGAFAASINVTARRERLRLGAHWLALCVALGRTTPAVDTHDLQGGARHA